MTSNCAFEIIAAASVGLRQSLKRLSPKPEMSSRVTGTRGFVVPGPKFELNVSSIGVRTVSIVGRPLKRALWSCHAAPGRLGDSCGPNRSSGAA